MATLFISDLHLQPAHRRLTELFEQFMRNEAPRAGALYILGDLFDVWVGDDDEREEICHYVGILRKLTDNGVPLYIMHGNRDFLLGEQFARACGARLIPDPTVIDLYGEPTLLMHGDSLCTDDVEHQKTRALLRSAQWQKDFLGRSLQQRIELAKGYRQQSREATRNKPEAIMDVNPGAVVDAMRAHGVTRLIHGHTHRPGVHVVQLDNAADGVPRQGTRIVLGDWDRRGSVLICNRQGCELTRYERDDTTRLAGGL
jgi:UDP-2,3-diacylglucosamine hydrolase